MNLARRTAVACLTPLLRRAARAYVVGDRLDDALAARSRLAASGIGCTLGYFNDERESPAEVACRYRQALAALGADDHLSIKPPALAFDDALLATLAKQAAARGIRLHLDSHGPATAEPTLRVAARMLAVVSADRLGLTLPGRWRRSVGDARWAADRRLPVRVVKGQWPERDDRPAELVDGLLDVVDALCGSDAPVAVASHDPAVIAPALQRLQRSGTRCELQLLHGLPQREPCRLAARFGVPVRMYLPYGAAHLPYMLGRALAQPYLIGWLARDLCQGLRPRRLRSPQPG